MTKRRRFTAEFKARVALDALRGDKTIQEIAAKGRVHRVRRLMRLMGLSAIYQAPRTSQPHPAHRIYPYLLTGMAIDRPNHVWCADITYIPVQRGFLYLVAIMDWATRHVLAWRLSNTMDAGFCVEALNEALSKYGKPEIFNTDQGSQFTSFDFTDVLKGAEITISMDGRGRCMDNIFIERPHSALAGRTPAEAHDAGWPVDMMDKPDGLMRPVRGFSVYRISLI